MNGDGYVNFNDLNPFVAALVGAPTSLAVQRGYTWDSENRLTGFHMGTAQEGDYGGG